MKNKLRFLSPLLLLFGGCMPSHSETLSEKDMARDKAERPSEILEFVGIEPGMAVLDVFSGGGYFSEKLADAVGPDGTVYAWNNAFFLRISEEQRQERKLGERYMQVTILNDEIQDLDWPEGLDAVMMTTVFHDLWVPRIVGENFNAVDPVLSGIFESLRPGGKVLVIDHVAPEGSGARFAADLHRIEEAHVEKLFEEAGFTLAGKLDFLRSNKDDYTVSVFNKRIRGRTDRFIHLYEKPAG